MPAANDRSLWQEPDKYRFAQNMPDGVSAPEREYRDYSATYRGGKTPQERMADGGAPGEPDVLLDVPVVKVDEINFELNDLRAQVTLRPKVLDLVGLSVGADVYLGRVKLQILGVEAQALLKVRLDNVVAILDRVLTTIDRNPQIIEKLAESVGSAVEDVGAGAALAVEDVGRGAGRWGKGSTRRSESSARASDRRSRISAPASVRP